MWIQVHYWGEVEYDLSVRRQLELLEALRRPKREKTEVKQDHHTAKEEKKDHLTFCHHPPLVTLGRSSTQEDLMGWEGSIFQSQRGGKATYHGPSQIVAYPIIDLCQKRAYLRPRDVHDYLRSLEKWLVHSLKELSIEAHSGATHSGATHSGATHSGATHSGATHSGATHSGATHSGATHSGATHSGATHSGATHSGEDGNTEATGPLLSTQSNDNLMTGVWVGEKKIACIGIAIKSWITYHGIALNLWEDTQAFKGISACGFQSDIMTSVEEVLGQKLDRKEVTAILEKQFKNTFGP